jgi:ABC-type multidrug transport system permease subunit
MKTTIGENVFAIVLSGVAAAIAALVGFVGGIFLCEWLFTGEMTEWALIVAPALALVMAVAAFVIVFRKIITYGDPTSSSS